MWCGLPPESSAFAPCCLLAATAALWAIAALGALVFNAEGLTRVRETDVLLICLVAAGLVLAIHLAPEPAALIIAGAVAAHTLLMAGLVGADWWRQEARAPARRGP